jgi:mevalonate kinase
VDLARSAGAHGAKLAGAGGGGVVIALGPDPDAIVAAARAAGVDAFTVGIGRS